MMKLPPLERIHVPTKFALPDADADADVTASGTDMAMISRAVSKELNRPLNRTMVFSRIKMRVYLSADTRSFFGARQLHWGSWRSYERTIGFCRYLKEEDLRPWGALGEPVSRSAASFN
jgi:hypothetical protein